MKAVLNARFQTDGDFWFENPDKIIDLTRNPYNGCEIQYKHEVDKDDDELITFYLCATGDYYVRSIVRDFFENLLCNLRVGKSYLIGDIYEMINPILKNTVFNEAEDIVHAHQYLGGNYEGTSITLTIVKGESDHQRTRLEIENEYNELVKDTTLIETGPRSHGYANQARRNELLAEYRSTLSEEEQLAIYLHQHLCHSNHTDECSWSYEINGVHDDWNGYAHKEYLDMAKRMIEKCPDINMIKSIILAISNTAN